MNDAQRKHLVEGERRGMRYALSLPRQAPVGAAGAALGNRAGSSLEFREYREYQPGDDLRHIDWNAYARSDQLHVKLFREEVNPHLDVILDGSRSMALADSAKEQAVLELAGFFVAAAANASYAHTAWLLAERCQPVPNGTANPAVWEGLSFACAGNPSAALGQGPPAWRPRGLRVLVSDLLWAGDPLVFLRQLTERASAVAIVQLLARADVEPPPAGNLRLVDSETGQVRDIVLDVAAGKRYRDTLNRHQQNWHRACRQAGALLTTVVAEDLLRDWKLDELVAHEILKVCS